MKLNLSGPCGKLERALIHLDQLGDEMEALGRVAAGNVSLADEEVHPHPRGFRHLFRVGGVLAPRPVTGLIVGDYIQNLRSALDHLAWELVRQGTAWPPSNPKRIQFPIYRVGRSNDRSTSTFANRVGVELPGISADQRALIDSYQPYHRRNWHLASLANLSNYDKHRVVTPIHMLSGTLRMRHLQPTEGTIVEWNVLLPEGRRMQERTPLVEVIVDSANASVEMNTNTPTRVAFQERPRKRHRPRALEEIGEKVAEIVGECARHWGRREDATFCEGWSERGRKALGLPIPMKPGRIQSGP